MCMLPGGTVTQRLALGILIEHFAGKWPFWLSPRQIMVIPVGKGFVEYAEEVQSIFKKQGMWWYVWSPVFGRS